MKRQWQEIGLAWHIFLTKVGQFCFIMVGLFYFIIDRWINEAEEGALKSVSPSPPGPKVDPLARLKEENEHLNSLVRELQDKLETLSRISQITVSSKAPSLLEERPSRCPECGASRIWKNGTYRVTGERTSRSLMVKEKGTVQRFRCSYCGVKLYLVKKIKMRK